MADLVEDLKQVGVEALMFAVDVARAYKNFRVDPLDWPLMCIKWNQEVFVEMAIWSQVIILEHANGGKHDSQDLVSGGHSG